MLGLTCQKFLHSKKQALPKSNDKLDSTAKPAPEAKCAPAAAKKPVSNRTHAKNHVVDDWLLAKFANNIVVQDMQTHPGKDMYQSTSYASGLRRWKNSPGSFKGLMALQQG
jgi:hypothetical protein